MSRIFQRWEDDLFKIEPLLNVLKLLFAMLFVAHLAGCFFYFFSQARPQPHALPGSSAECQGPPPSLLHQPKVLLRGCCPRTVC